MLADLLAEKRVSLRAFARGVGANPTFVSQIIRGHRRPPLGRIGEWGQFLGVDAQRIALMVEGALLDHSPPEMQVLVSQLRQRIAELESQVQH